jgi:hypothetical protein
MANDCTCSPPMQRFVMLLPPQMLASLRAEARLRGVGVSEVVRGYIYQRQATDEKHLPSPPPDSRKKP